MSKCKQHKLVLLAYLFIINGLSFGQAIKINEIMSCNESVIQDSFGDFSDWIELCNVSERCINLEGFAITDDPEDSLKWIFPEIHLQPNTFLLFFASGRDIIDTTELHTNFKLLSEGETLYLYSSTGLLLDSFAGIRLFEDQSYGRLPDGGPDTLRLSLPTPGSSNNVLNHLKFSIQPGFYNTPQTLMINSILGDSVRYTVDCSIPKFTSPFIDSSLYLGYTYDWPNVVSEIPSSADQQMISYKAWEMPDQNLQKAHTIRLASFKDQNRTSKIYSLTFFIDSTIFSRFTMPVISLISDNRNFFDSDTGIYVPGIHFDTLNPEWTGNFFQRGENWERDVSITFFSESGNLELLQDAGMRIHGGKTRQAAQKSLKFFARKEYSLNKFYFPLLPNREVEEYNSFILRTSLASWNDELIISDIAAQQVISGLEMDYQEYHPVTVFLNGEYWGIQTIRDDISEEYIAYTHGLDKDSVQVFDDLSQCYADLISYLNEHDLSSEEHYIHLCSVMDMENYIDYQISEMFFKNYDWPSNNIKMWKEDKADSKIKWIFYDLDAGFNNADYNMFFHCTLNDTNVQWPNSPVSTLIFRSLINNESFVEDFVERYAELLNIVFQKDSSIQVVTAVKNKYYEEIPFHADRWHYPESQEIWEMNINQYIEQFLIHRPCAVRGHIMDFFMLDEFGFNCDAGYTIWKAKDVEIFPNPTQNFAFIKNSSEEMIACSISIYDISGRQLSNCGNYLIPPSERIALDVSAFEPGTYIVLIRGKGVSIRKALVIIN